MAARGGRPAPYVVSQLGGAYYNVPDFLDTQHPVRTAEDAEAYLSRLDQFGRNLEQETERVRHDAAVRVIPPDFVLDKAIGNLAAAARARRPAETTLVRSLVRRAARPRSPAIMAAARARSSPAGSRARSTPDRGAARRPPRAPSTTPAAGGCRAARLITPGASAPTPRRR